MPYGKSTAVFGFKLFGEVLYKICAIVGAQLALLFLFEDALAQVPARMSLMKEVLMLLVPISFMVILYCLLLVNVVMLKVNLGLCSQIS